MSLIPYSVSPYLLLVLVLSFLLCLPRLPFAGEKSEPSLKGTTQLEKFLSTSGSIIVKEFHRLGIVDGDTGVVEFVTLVLYQPGPETKRTKGLKIEVHEENTYKKAHTSFLDFEEIASLSKAIEYMTKVAKDWKVKPREYTEVIYSSKGDLQIGLVVSNGNIRAFMQSGTYSGATAVLNVETLPEVKAKVDEGIDYLKQR